MLINALNCDLSADANLNILLRGPTKEQHSKEFDQTPGVTGASNLKKCAQNFTDLGYDLVDHTVSG